MNSRNLLWISLEGYTFQAGFWFGKKTEPLVEDSELSENIKADFRKAEQNKMGRGLSIKVRTSSYLDRVMELINFKYLLK